MAFWEILLPKYRDYDLAIDSLPVVRFIGDMASQVPRVLVLHSFRSVDKVVSTKESRGPAHNESISIVFLPDSIIVTLCEFIFSSINMILE